MYLQKGISIKLFYSGVLKVTNKKSRIWSQIRESKVWIRGSRSVPKCHGSGTLVPSILVLIFELSRFYDSLLEDLYPERSGAESLDPKQHKLTTSTFKIPMYGKGEGMVSTFKKNYVTY
jgi:hypothetical protein